MKKLLLSMGLVAALAVPSLAAEKGSPAVKSISSLAFGPKGVLFVGDPQSATIFAVETADTKPAGTGEINIEKFDETIASMLGVSKSDMTISDMKVNPASGNAFVSVTRGKGASAIPVVMKIDRATGKASEFSLKDVAFTSVKLPNATDRQRMEAITNMGYSDGKLIVAGLSNEEFSSTLRTIPFPFQDADKGASIEIFHGAHGRLETNAPVRTFTTYTIGKTNYLLAAYTCTPLVQIPMTDLKPGAKIKGKTIAELGAGNKPLDIIVYQKDGSDYLLLSNSARGVMKIPTAGIETTMPISTPVRGGTGKAGLAYTTIDSMKGVVQLDKLDDTHAIVLIQGADKSIALKSVMLP